MKTLLVYFLCLPRMNRLRIVVLLVVSTCSSLADEFVYHYQLGLTNQTGWTTTWRYDYILDGSARAQITSLW